ncbi:30S ribosomal protein S15 [Patescibacteria group bacterium]|nr:30S ribosomal protein S15 [Patescibacteria group bacterium]
MLDKKVKDRIIKKFKTHETDTGSTQVQVALLTEEIKQLTEHLKMHKKDFSSRRGLIRKVAERRRLLNYLHREDAQGWEDLVKTLKLKTPKPAEKKQEVIDREEAHQAGANDPKIEADSSESSEDEEKK